MSNDNKRLMEAFGFGEEDGEHFLDGAQIRFNAAYDKDFLALGDILTEWQLSQAIGTPEKMVEYLGLDTAGGTHQ